MLSPTAALAYKVDEVLRTQIKDLQSPSPDEVHHLVYELELRSAELEEQNEELRKTHQQLEAYRDRYIDLYDFAPLGYVTLDEDGYVQEINLAGAKLLGVERDELTGYPLSDYVSNDYKKVFLDHLGQCVGERREVTSELCFAATTDGRLRCSFTAFRSWVRTRRRSARRPSPTSRSERSWRKRSADHRSFCKR